jgi:putative Mg2+ transporter-C (MgtC) family protein
VERPKQVNIVRQLFYSNQTIAIFMATILTIGALESLLIAIVLGAIVGIEREHAYRPAGLRTHMLVSLGSCLFTLMSTQFGGQPAQVAGGIVAGIGFIGAGTIWAEKDKVKV